MRLDIHAPWSVNEYLRDTIEEKTGKLTKIFDRITHIDVFLKKGDNTGVEELITEVRVRIPGKELFASSHSENFEKGVADAVDKVKRQLVKKVERMHEK